MLLSCVIALSVAGSTPTVGDFSGLTPGCRRIYELREGKRVGQMVEEVGPSQKIGGKVVYPVTISSEGTVGSRTYFAIDGDTLNVMAISERVLLKSPMPVIKVGPGLVRWEFKENSPVSPQANPVTVSAESSLKGKRRILGAERDVLEVKFTAESRPGDVPFKLSQTVLYAAGIGMVEFEMESTLSQTTVKSKRTLKQFVAPKQAG